MVVLCENTFHEVAVVLSKAEINHLVVDVAGCVETHHQMAHLGADAVSVVARDAVQIRRNVAEELRNLQTLIFIFIFAFVDFPTHGSDVACFENSLTVGRNQTEQVVVARQFFGLQPFIGRKKQNDTACDG